MLGSMDIRALSADPGQVPTAIARAASATGIEFSYLLKQAQAESGLNPTAHAHGSSASGLFQFIDQTWLAVIKRHGAAHGLGWAADAIHWVGGKLGISDPATRHAVLALRQEPQTAALMAGEHAADNKAGLEARLGRAVGSAELALAHFLGLGGATKFLRALGHDPTAPAVHSAPHAAHANQSIFFARNGSARSLEAVFSHIAARFAGDPPVTPANPTQLAEASASTASKPPYARTAYMLLAEFGG